MNFFSYDLSLTYSSFIVFLRSVFCLSKISAVVKSSIFLSPSFVVAWTIDWNVVLSSCLEFLVTSLLLVGSSGAYWHDYILRRFQDLLIHPQSLDYCSWFVSREYTFKISRWPNSFIDFRNWAIRSWIINGFTIKSTSFSPIRVISFRIGGIN